MYFQDTPNTSTISDASHDFIQLIANSDYVKYLYRNSPTNRLLYMSTDANNNEVIVGRDTPRAWFRLRVVSNIVSTLTSSVTASEEVMDVSGNISTRIIDETTEIVGIGEKSIFGNDLGNETIRASEE